VTLSPSRRRWEDVKTWRVCLALALASLIPPFVLNGSSTLLAWRTDPGFLHHALLSLLEAVSTAALWWVFSRLIYAYVGARRHRLVGRTECLLLGCFKALSYPPVDTLAKASLAWLRFRNDLDIGYLNWVAGFFAFFASPTLVITLAVMLTPIGLFAGWMLWRMAVRRAPVQIGNVAPLFD
jgi:hypothetical protein